MLNRLTCEAEAWADAGTAKVDEKVALRKPAWSKLHKDTAHASPPAPAGLLTGQHARAS